MTPSPGLSPLSSFRGSHTATLLANGPAATNGKDLIVGGHNVQSAELYDPATGTSTPTGGMNVAPIIRRPCSTTARCSSRAAGISRTTRRKHAVVRGALSSRHGHVRAVADDDVEQPRVSHRDDTRQRPCRSPAPVGPCCSTDLNSAEIYTPQFSHVRASAGDDDGRAPAAHGDAIERQPSRDRRWLGTRQLQHNQSRSSTRRHRCSRSCLRA